MRRNKRKKVKHIPQADLERFWESYPKTKAVYDYIQEHPGITAGGIADALGEKQVYAHVNRLEEYMLVSVQEQRDRHHLVKHYTIKELPDKRTSNAQQQQVMEPEVQMILPTRKEAMQDSYFEAMFEECLFDDLNTDITRPNFLFNIGGVDCVASGSIVAVSGNPGSGKSTALAIMAGVLLSGHDFGTIQSKKKCHRILWIDTEKDPFSCSRRMLTLRTVAQFDNDKTLREQGVDYMRMKPKSEEDRISFLEWAAAQNSSASRWDAVFIDGLFDLIDDANKIRQVNRVMLMLSRFSESGATVFGMLHSNKDRKDDNMREVLGTEFYRLCTNRFIVRGHGQKENHIIEHEKANDTMLAPKVLFKCDADGTALPVTEDVKDGEKANSEDVKIKYSPTVANEEKIKSILSDGVLLSRNELIKEMGKGNDGIKKDNAAKIIKKAYESGLINKEDGKYGKYYLAEG